MATISNNLALSANAFAKCAPNIGTNIKQCGTVGLCNARPLTSDDLTDAYTKSGEYRVMEALLMADMEIKMCEATQNGLYDFLMANKVNMSKKVIAHGRDSGLLQIAPFIKARQYSPINNEYWLFNSGGVSGQNWEVIVHSAGNVPVDVRSFPVGINVFLNSAGAGGAVSRTAWKVVTSTLEGDDEIALVLESSNANSNLDPDKIDSTPQEGYLTVGGNNVSDYEKECQEKPAYMTKKLVPFWVKTRRYSFCKSSKYDQYRALMMANNPLYREFGDVPDIERNRQLAMDFQKSFVQDFFWGKPLANQNMADYDQLEDITTDPGDLYAADSATHLGAEGDICVGKRAEPVGVYEQLAECGRVVDLLAMQLNLPAVFQAFYDIIRVRSSQGNNNRIIDVFTDSVTAELINRAMIAYYASKSADHNGDSTLRLTMDASGFSLAKKADFGFLYRSYPLFWPAGVTMNVLTHYAFDDEIAVATDAGIPDSARRLWILDFSGIYPGIIASNRVVHNTGDLKTLATVNNDFACVMKVHTKQQTLNSQTDTTIVECPGGNLIIENFSSEVPDITETPGLRYPSSTTTTTPASPR
jgi:hypothetical protein